MCCVVAVRSAATVCVSVRSMLLCDSACAWTPSAALLTSLDRASTAGTPTVGGGYREREVVIETRRQGRGEGHNEARAAEAEP